MKSLKFKTEMQRIRLTKNGMFIIWFVVKILFRCYIHPFMIQNVQIFCGILFIRYNFMTYLQSEVYINKTSQDILSMVWFFKNVICHTECMFKIFTTKNYCLSALYFTDIISCNGLLNSNFCSLNNHHHSFNWKYCLRTIDSAYLISCNGFLNPHCYWWCCYPYAVRSVLVIIVMDYFVDWFDVFSPDLRIWSNCQFVCMKLSNIWK